MLNTPSRPRPFLRLVHLASLATCLALPGALARADGGFVPLPTLAPDAPTDLALRIVSYDGNTNGEMVVEVRNGGRAPTPFRAEGIYFVPKGDPENAPQRLGAAGPVAEVAGGRKGAYTDEVSVAPGQTKRLRLKVFCIDSHRASPNSRTGFSLAKARMPKALRENIRRDAKRAVAEKAGSVDAAMMDIQSATWANRDRAWIRLEGERKREKVSGDRRRSVPTPELEFID